MTAGKPHLAALCAAALIASAAAPDNAARRGEWIYWHGMGVNGDPIAANAGSVELRGAAAACSNCHGHPLDGGGEGGVAAPPLAWRELTGPGDAQSYREEDFAVSLREGRARDGRELHALMPRYRLGGEDLDSLIAFLRGHHMLPGISVDTISVATIIPRHPALRPLGLRSAAKVAALVQADRDTYFGRRLRHIVLDAALPDEELAARLDRDPPLLVVASVGLTDQGQIAALLAARRIVNFAPVAALSGDEPNHQVISLRPALLDQAVALARAMEDAHGCISVIAADDPLSARTAQRLQLVFDTADDCQAALVLAPPSLLSATLRKLDRSRIRHLYASGEQLGDQVASLARMCRLTVAVAAPGSLQDQVEANAAGAITALRQALSRAGRELSPNQVLHGLAAAIPPHEPVIHAFDHPDECALMD